MFSDNFSGHLKHYLVNHQLRTFLQPKTARNLQIWQSAAKSRILIDSLAICITFLAKNKSGGSILAVNRLEKGYLFHCVANIVMKTCVLASICQSGEIHHFFGYGATATSPQVLSTAERPAGVRQGRRDVLSPQVSSAAERPVGGGSPRRLVSAGYYHRGAACRSEAGPT